MVQPHDRGEGVQVAGFRASERCGIDGYHERGLLTGVLLPTSPTRGGGGAVTMRRGPGEVSPKQLTDISLPRNLRPVSIPDLWSSPSKAAWEQAHERYIPVIEGQGVQRLPDLDRWYRESLPAAIASRPHAHVTHGELVKVTEWKMARGIWRPRNLALVKGNTEAAVEEVSAEALAAIPDPRRPIALLAELSGVGPATASAVAAAAAPHAYPFFDELVAAQVPGLGAVKFTPGYYGRYAAALRERAAALGWSPVRVEQALWANVGGKAGL